MLVEGFRYHMPLAFPNNCPNSEHVRSSGRFSLEAVPGTRIHRLLFISLDRAKITWIRL
jgi:hypothetical protein